MKGEAPLNTRRGEGEEGEEGKFRSGYMPCDER